MMRIGVSGHRQLRDEGIAVEMTANVLDRLLGQTDDAVIVSSLAEGADRLVAEVVLGRGGAARLDVVLPLPADDYLADFESEESQQEFWNLLGRAASVTVVEQVPGEPRTAAYERAGRQVVDSTDVLIALWDGRPSRGRGSTAELVQYALANDAVVEVVLVERARA